MAKVVSEPVSDSIQEVQKDVKINIEEKMKNLKIAAARFLKQINAIQTGEKYNELISINQENLKELLETQSMQDLINNPKQVLNKLMGYSATRKNGTQIMTRIKKREKILEYIFMFQKEINSFLNIGTITMTYVDDDGTLYKISENIEKNLLANSRFKDGKFIGLSLTDTLKKEIEKEKKQEKDNSWQKLLTKRNEQVVKLYQKIMNEKDQLNFANKDEEAYINKLLPTLYKNRRKIEKEESKKRKKITKETFTTDFFLVTNRYNRLTFNHINNLGILKEAYVAALFDKKTTITGPNNESANILYDNYICHVDNLYGIFGGDVSILQESGPSKDLAIKSGSFSSENYSQLISFANYILSKSSSNDFLKNLGLQNNDENMRKFFKDFTNQKIAEINGGLNRKAADAVRSIFEKKGITDIQFILYN